MTSLRHFIRAGAFVCGVLITGVVRPELATFYAATQAGAAQATTSQSAATKLLIFVCAVQIGAEESSVTQTPDGWTIEGAGRLGFPIDVTTRRLEVKYDPNWAPQELTIDAV